MVQENEKCEHQISLTSEHKMKNEIKNMTKKGKLRGANIWLVSNSTCMRVRVPIN